MRFAGLWRHRDFLRLWAGETVSIFGTIVGRLALAFTAIVWLEASALEVAILGICEMTPGFLFGVFAGVWVDRLPRRAVMISADLGRFAILATVPLAALGDSLTIWHVFAAAGTRAVLDAFFESAYQAYLPNLVGPEHVLEGNSKLTASSSVAEVSGFGVAGWLTQAFTAPGAVLVDAVSFLASALAVWRIRAPEPSRADGHVEPPFWAAAREGLRAVTHGPLLRSMVLALVAHRLPMGIFGAVFVLFVTRELDLGPGIQGSIYAIGGVTSLLGALLAARSGAWHLGRSMTIAAALRSVGAALPAAAAGPVGVRIGLNAASQCVTDPAWTYYDIHEVSLRQAVTPNAVLGRVAATFRAAEFGATLVGVAIGGIIAEAVGLRAAIVVAAVGAIAGVPVFALSPAARVERLPSTAPG